MVGADGRPTGERWQEPAAGLHEPRRVLRPQPDPDLVQRAAPQALGAAGGFGAPRTRRRGLGPVAAPARPAAVRPGRARALPAPPGRADGRRRAPRARAACAASSATPSSSAKAQARAARQRDRRALRRARPRRAISALSGRFGTSRPSSNAHTAGPSSSPTIAASRSPRASAATPCAARRSAHQASPGQRRAGIAPGCSRASQPAPVPCRKRWPQHARRRSRRLRCTTAAPVRALELPARGRQAPAQVGVATRSARLPEAADRVERLPPHGAVRGLRERPAAVAERHLLGHRVLQLRVAHRRAARPLPPARR